MDRLARWNASFDLYDIDRDDAISLADRQRGYERVLEQKGLPDQSVKYYSGLFEKYQKNLLKADLNQDGRTTREEWLEFFGKELKRGDVHLPSASLFRTIRTEFTNFDVDGDGLVNFTDYCKAAVAFRVRAKIDLLRAHFHTLCDRVGAEERLDPDQFLALQVEIWCADGDVPFMFPTRTAVVTEEKTVTDG